MDCQWNRRHTLHFNSARLDANNAKNTPVLKRPNNVKETCIDEGHVTSNKHSVRR